MAKPLAGSGGQGSDDGPTSYSLARMNGVPFNVLKANGEWRLQ